MRTRIRVLPKVSARPLWALMIALGLLHGAIGAWAVYGLSQVSIPGTSLVSSWGLVRAALLTLAGFSFPAFLLGCVVGRVHQRIGINLLCGVCYGAATTLGIIAVVVRLNPEMLLLPWQMKVWGVALIGIAVAACVYGALVAGIVGAALLLGCAKERWLGRRVVTQPGLLCWTCGYNLGVATLTTCPECGRSFRASEFPGNNSLDLLQLLARWRRRLLALACALCLVPIVYMLFLHTIPSARFLASRPAGADVRRIWSVSQYMNGALGLAWFIPDADNPDSGISVQYVPASAHGETHLVISRACVSDPAASAGVTTPREFQSVGSGSVEVGVDVRGAMMERVLARGVPIGLSDAIRRAASDASWTIAPYPTSPQRPKPLDPAPFFDEATTGIQPNGK